MTTSGWLWLALDAAVVLALVATLGAVLARRRELAGSVLLGVVSVATGIALGARGPDVPDGWINVLQEGLGQLHVRELDGRGAHGGDGFLALLDLLVPRVAGDGLRTLVRWNVGLSIANAGLFLVIARQCVGRLASVVLTIVFALHPVALNVTVSELPCAVLTSVFLLGVIAAAASNDDALGPRARWLGWLTLTGLAAIAASLRIETVIVGAPAVLMRALCLRYGSRRCDEIWERGLARVGRFLAGPPIRVLGALGAVFALRLGARMLELRGVDGSSDPLSVAGFALPATLAMSLPLGAVVLFVLGSIHAFMRPSRFLQLPVALVVLYDVYRSEGHAGTAPFEMLRYLGSVAPVALVLALFGWRELVAIGERLGWSTDAMRVARMLTALSLGCWNLTGIVCFDDALEFNSRPRSVTWEPSQYLVLQRDQQIEERYLLELLDRFPACAFVARVVPSESVGDRGFSDVPVPDWGALWFGTIIAEPDGRRARPWRGTPADLAADVDTQCVLYYRSLDCNLANAADICDQDAAGLALVEERRQPDRRYYFHVRMQAELRLAVYRVR